MNLVIITAVIAVAGAAKLDRTYLPPPSAETAGGTPGILQAPLTRSSEQGLETPRLPTGSYTNNFQGVVVDAAAPGTRASADTDLSGLGGPRPSYGSTDSKVGDAAFRGSVAGFRDAPIRSASSLEHPGQITHHSGGYSINSQGNSAQSLQGFPSNGASSEENRSERPQAAKDRNSNILNFNNDVSSDVYSYGFETDNGITVGENGVAVNGVQAEGGYSYQGDDGQVYKITYTAGEGGYRPQGNHLPTPPPIPEEILKSLEKNAEEEAAGHVDDGSYDAQKYNTDSDYTHDNGGNNQYNRPQPSQFGKRPESDATASSMINQNSQAFGQPGNFGSGNHNTHSAINGQSSHGNFGSSPFRPGSIGQNSHSNFNEQSQGNGDSGSAHFGAGSNGQNSQFAINGQSQGNGDSGSANFGPGSNGQNSHSAFNGQSQGNGDSGSAHFGVGSNGQNSHSAFNGQGNGDSGSAHFGAGSNGQNPQLAFNAQSNQGNKYNSNSGSSQNGEDNSQNIQHSHSSQQNGPQIGINSGNGVTLDQSGNKSPSGSQYHQQEFNSQFNSQSAKPASGQNTGTLGLNAGTQIQFGSQSMNGQNQGFNGFTGASNYHQEMPSKYNKQSQSQFSSSGSGAPSIPTGNYNKPIEGPVQVNQFGSSTNYNRLPQTQGQFGANNEYLPPYSSLSPGSNSNFVNSGSSLSGFNSNLDQKPEKIEKSPSSFISNGQTSGVSSASASASFGQPALRPSAAHTVPDVISKPTAVPDTELTTPLEPNEKPSTTNSQFSSQSTNSGSLGSNSINQQPQTQFGFQGNSADKQSSQILSPSFPTSSSQFSSNSQFGTAPIQSTFPVSSGKEPGSNNKPQITHNSFGNKPSYNQVSELPQQYNQPSKPFDKPSVHPQGSRFPSSSFNQPNGVASQNLLFNQQNHFQSSSQPSGSPSFASVAPTSATQFTQTHGSTSSNYNGITQAAISPFPSAAPTSVSQFGTAENGQLGSKPTFNQQSAFSSPFQSASNQQNKPAFSQQSGQQSFLSSPVAQFGQKPTQPQQFGQSESSGLSHGSPQEQTSVTQQNSGTIYQYNKPAVAQAPQFGQKPTLLGQSETTPQSLIGLSQQQTSATQQNGGTIYQYNRPAEVHTPQFEQKPTQFGQSNTKLESSDGSTQQQTTVTQQYEGTIYQYNKPAEVLPSPTPDSSSSQTIETGITSASKPIFGQFQENQLPTQQNIKPQFGSQTQSLSQNSFSTHQQTDFTQGSLGPQTNKPFGSAPSTAQYGQHSSSGHDSFQSQHNTGSQFGALPSFKPQSGQITQSALESSSSTQLNHQGAQSSPFGAASQGAQSTFGSKPQFSSPSQLTQTTNFVGSSQTSQPGRGSGSQSQFNTQAIGNGASSQDNGYVYPKNPQPQFGESPKNQFGQNPAFGSSQSANSQLSGSFNQQPYQTQFSSKPAFGNPSQTQFGQNAQTTHGQKTPNSLIKPFDQPQFGQASSQAIASGQASASAFASNSPQAKPFSQSNQSQGSQQIGAQNSKPFNSNGQGASGSKPYGALNLSQFGVNESTDISNPLFESPCCQGSKDSAPSQSTVRPSISGQEDQASFQGTQNFNAQSFAGKGEEFGGPRPPPRFDDNTGYHY